MLNRYRDRHDAGRVLAQRLAHYARRPDVQVLALPRGGVPVAFEVIRELSAPLDVFIVRKLGVPGQPELAMGAIASGGVRVVNDEVVRLLGIQDRELMAVAERERNEMRRRELMYRGDRPMPTLKDRIVVLVDDGLATGATVRAAVAALRKFEPARIVLAVPVGAPGAIGEMGTLCDEVVCPLIPRTFSAVGQWYEDFSETTDEDVRVLLARASGHLPMAGSGPAGTL